MSSETEQLIAKTRHVHRKLTILLTVGMLLMESAADTNRIVRNMKRIAAFLGLDEQHLHIDVLYGTLKVNYSDEAHSFSRFVHSDRYTINMKAIAAVSQLSWRAIQEDYSVQRFERVVERIRRMKPDYPAWMVTLGASMGCGGFSVLFGGDWPSFVPAMLAGLAGFSLRFFLLKDRFNFYMVTALSAFVATLTAWLMLYVMPEGFTERPYHPFLSCALFLVPGVALINFLDDMIDNYLSMGLARLANAVVQIASMTFGIVLAVSICGVTNFLTMLDMTPIISYWEAAIATGISAMGFGLIFNVPRRTLPAVAALGILAMCTRMFVAFELGQGLIIGTLAGASLISLLAVRLVQPTRSPNHVLAIPSVIPMVPGIMMYRGLFGFIQYGNEIEGFLRSFNFLLDAALIVLCISIGVAIPNIFARRWIASSRKQQLQDLIEERRKRGKFVNLSEFD
ncbi:threonine/serine exporter family protein [Alloprevotella sp. OH1205_COT-284]|uniref:threonine/serine ThrE exporter family protein n=1 Tax=Alloprevotella sp. OH1205_COT-284 TaxID=2491043 RepID=UPI000F5EA121|nr:threonine/serine exporter family protein [Alloprevotella sp. OH1205_COT-284]RRD79837.1 threonine/serine exporter family protein [Alloprevotella sp. OH1205_COT-284]